MKRNNKSGNRRSEPHKGQDAFTKNISVKEYDELAKEADKERTRKPGSQSQSGSGRHNNGRGGGK